MRALKPPARENKKSKKKSKASWNPNPNFVIAVTTVIIAALPEARSVVPVVAGDGASIPAVAGDGFSLPPATLANAALAALTDAATSAALAEAIAGRWEEWDEERDREREEWDEERDREREESCESETGSERESVGVGRRCQD